MKSLKEHIGNQKKMEKKILSPPPLNLDPQNARHNTFINRFKLLIECNFLAMILATC
jgi:hypothetical protein